MIVSGYMFGVNVRGRGVYPAAQTNLGTDEAMVKFSKPRFERSCSSKNCTPAARLRKSEMVGAYECVRQLKNGAPAVFFL